jgi:hypothetical protein
MPQSQGKPSHAAGFERSTDSVTALAETSFGRVLLHLACLLRDHRVRWHWSGIVREFRHCRCN